MEASSLIVGIPEDCHAIGPKESLSHMKIQLALHGLNELQNYTGHHSRHRESWDQRKVLLSSFQHLEMLSITWLSHPILHLHRSCSNILLGGMIANMNPIGSYTGQTSDRTSSQVGGCSHGTTLNLNVSVSTTQKILKSILLSIGFKFRSRIWTPLLSLREVQFSWQSDVYKSIWSNGNHHLTQITKVMDENSLIHIFHWA